MIRAHKRFGQHFLHDPAVIARIVAAIAPLRTDALLEIGPGSGALTEPLLVTAGALDAVEIDRDLVAALRARFAGRGLALHECDALQFDWSALAAQRGRKLRLVGNLPYNISTPLLFRLLTHADAIEDMHFMLQQEVADRIVAAPGSGAYGRLGVMLAPWVQTTRLFVIGPGAFQPPPKVWSAIVRLQPHPAPDWAKLPEFAAVVAAAFGQRRKTLRNALHALLSSEQIAAAGIDPQARAENLTPEQFGTLAQAAVSVLH